MIEYINNLEVEVYQSSATPQTGNRRWYWRATARNGRIVGSSEQGYRSRTWAVRKARQFAKGYVPVRAR